MAVIGVVPAAGSGSRLRAGPDFWLGSKEIMPVRGRPVIEYLLDQLQAVPGIAVRVVTRSDKRDLLGYLARRHLDVVLGEPPDVAASLQLGVEGLAADDVVLVGFPDTVWRSAAGFAALVSALDDPAVDVALGLFLLPDVRAADEVVADPDGVVLRVVPKPEDPTSLWTWGCVAARRHVLAGLAYHREPGDLWNALAQARQGAVRGVRMGADFLDVGTPAGRARAEQG